MTISILQNLITIPYGELTHNRDDFLKIDTVEFKLPSSNAGKLQYSTQCKGKAHHVR